MFVPATRPDSYDVVVVGAGPVGLAAARLLALRGVTVAVVDPQRIVCQHPRATHLDDETMRTLQTLGAADFEKDYLRQSGWILEDADGVPFLEFSHPDAESDQGWATDYQSHQPDIESRLRGLLAGGEGAALWLGWEATGVDQDDHQVTLRLQERDTGRVQEIRGSYAVGADGAGSFVQHAMGMEVEDLHGTQTSLIIDVHPFEHPDGLPRTTGFIRCAKDLPVTYCPLFPPLLRFEFMLGDHHDVHEMERPDSVYELLSPWLAPGSYRITRTDAYQWHAHLVHGWRNGRVLVAGDAAHTMPPMLGQGLCSGLRDAMNLAWKLAMVVRGQASESLLDTYESERAPHVTPYIVESARQANMIEDFGHGHVPPPAGAPQVLERHRPLLGPGLVDEPAGAIGQLAPQPRDGDGARLDDVTGYRFAVVGADGVIAGVDDATRALWRRLDAVVLPGGGHDYAAWLASHGAAVALVRPDRYVHALAAGTSDLEEATRALAGRVLRAGVTA
ncbi:bifunctional 3-(3-hydroxy-phenyl)propionate/3-hydroxycinnamic acid hydroxylase [Spirillospora sp. NPDC000708]